MCQFVRDIRARNSHFINSSAHERQSDSACGENKSTENNLRLGRDYDIRRWCDVSNFKVGLHKCNVHVARFYAASLYCGAKRLDVYRISIYHGESWLAVR